MGARFLLLGESGGGGSLFIITVCDFTHPGEKPPIFSFSFFNVLKFHCSHLNFNDRQPRHSKLRYDARKRKPNDWTRPPLEYSSEEESLVRGQFTAWIRTD